MREVKVTRFVRARPEEVGRVLDPETVVAAEGSFSVAAVEETDEGTVVTVSGPGVQLPLRFERRADGYYYAAEGEVGPFDRMETRLVVDAEDEGARLTLRSTVSLNLPLPFADRIGAWKRRGELERALEHLAGEVA